MFLNIFCPLGEINPFVFRIFFQVFRGFLEIMKNGVRYLVAMTPSFMTEASVLGRAATSHQRVHPILQQNFGTNVSKLNIFLNVFISNAISIQITSLFCLI